MTTNSIYATFDDPAMAEKATGALLDYGVRAEHISLILPEGYATTKDGDSVTAKDISDTAKGGISTTTPGDAASGAVKGAGIGLVGGVLAGLAAVFIPGVGLVLGGGALALALAGTAGTTAAGAIAGGVTGYLKDQGIPDHAVEEYGKILQRGGAIVSVTPTDEKVSGSDIRTVLTKYNGSISAYDPAVNPALVQEDSLGSRGYLK